MNRSTLVYFPKMNKTTIARQTRGAKSGRGIGAVLLDGGLGGQSSYFSMDDYLATTKAPAPIGSGFRGLDKIRSKMENLVIKPTIRKPTNIKFSL